MANKLFQDKKPEFEAAKKKLENIKKNDLVFLGNLNNVVEIIDLTCQCLLILRVNSKAKPPLSWANAR